jgi:hypothetical protein
MIELEAEFAQFEEAAFICKFENAGGTWLALDQTGYHTYDGSHLHREAAEKFSSDLAQKIQALKTE